MNQRQLNSLQMFKTVAVLFGQQPAVWNTTAPVTECFNNFKTLLNTIEAQGLKQQASDTVGFTANKNAVRDMLEQQVLTLAIKMRAFAKMTKNEVIKQAVNFSQSDLDRLKDQALINCCQLVYEKGLENKATLTPYKVSDANLAELLTTLTTYKPLTAERDTVGKQRSVSTDELQVLFNQTREELDSLDDLVEALVEDAAFVASYQEARKVFDRTGRGAAKVATPEA